MLLRNGAAVNHANNVSTARYQSTGYIHLIIIIIPVATRLWNIGMFSHGNNQSHVWPIFCEIIKMFCDICSCDFIKVSNRDMRVLNSDQQSLYSNISRKKSGVFSCFCVSVYFNTSFHRFNPLIEIYSMAISQWNSVFIFIGFRNSYQTNLMLPID